MSTSIGGTNWSAPRKADAFAGSGHQIMPTIAFAGGKLALAYYDLRDDARGGFEDLVFEYGQAAFEHVHGHDGGPAVRAVVPRASLIASRRLAAAPHA